MDRRSQPYDARTARLASVCTMASTRSRLMACRTRRGEVSAQWRVRAVRNCPGHLGRSECRQGIYRACLSERWSRRRLRAYTQRSVEVRETLKCP
jgi:hypothetical protein